jgi:hypothetical protein
MAGRALTSSALLLFLVAGSSQALAQDEGIAIGEPNPSAPQGQAERPAAAVPKLLGSGKGADGTHVFLFGRQGAPPVIYMGQPGQLQEVEVLGIERYPGKFVVDTFEHGEMQFNTPNKGSRSWSVTIPGEVGFNAKHPTRVLSGAPDKAVFVEAMQRMGFVRRTPLSSQTLPPPSGRVVENTRASSSLAGGDRLGGVTLMKKSAVTAKARRFRRPPTSRLKAHVQGRRTTGRTPTARTH